MVFGYSWKPLPSEKKKDSLYSGSQRFHMPSQTTVRPQRVHEPGAPSDPSSHTVAREEAELTREDTESPPDPSTLSVTQDEDQPEALRDGMSSPSSTETDKR